MVTAVRFLNGQEAFPLTTAAQNIPVFLRKSLLHKKHFFEWLKTANFSIVCGTVTLKSPLSRESDAPHVHQRPRKHPPRCTLDCGFKASESPALRGFVGGLRALATAVLYLVLKSNGLRHSKNLPVKFGFSPIDTPANIAKKLPPQCCSKPLFIALFIFSHKWPTFAFTGESEYTLGFAQRIAHNGTHGETGAFPPPATARLCAASEIFLFRHAFIYIHFPVLCEPSLSATVLSQTIFHRVFQLLAQTAHVRFCRQKRVHSALLKGSHTRACTAKHGPSGRGRYHYPRSVPHVHKYPRPGCQNGKLCRFWVLVWCALEERREPSEQRCAYARRCSEASRPRWAA